MNRSLVKCVGIESGGVRTPVIIIYSYCWNCKYYEYVGIECGVVIKFIVFIYK